MTNPFSKKQENKSDNNAFAAAMNPFGGMATVEDRSPLLPAGVQAKAKISKVRIQLPQKGSQIGLAVYVDMVLEEVFAGETVSIKKGAACAHRISGFTGNGAEFSFRELKQFLLCALHSDGLANDSDTDENGNKDPMFWVNLPTQVADADTCVGKRIFIETAAKGKGEFQKVCGTFQIVE